MIHIYNLALCVAAGNRTNGYSLDLFSDEVDGRQGIIDLSISLHPKPIDDDQDHVCLYLR